MSARPAAQERRRTTTVAPANRARVRGMSAGSAPYSVEFDGRTVYDFLVSLGVGEADGHDILAEDRRWLTAARGSLSPARRDDLEACFGDSAKAFCGAVGALAVISPEARTARQFVTALATLDTRTVLHEMLGEVIRTPEARDQLDRILAGGADEIPAFAARTDDYHLESIAELLAAPSAWVDRIRGLLGEWVVRYEEVEERVERMIKRDLALREDERASLPQGELIERVTGGIRWLGEAAITRVVLSPSYFARPFNFVYAGRDWRLFAYPIADEALDSADESAPPPALVRLHRALGDESRLRILRLLRDRDMYLTELALQLEVSKPTMKHHLAQLRAAGLVTMTEEGSMTYYSLRRDRLEQADDEIRRFLT
ncbi:MAG: ArsR/SmtB family transcription factor [Candidatus Limnocylindrales bacterium]